ncbi:hypothetical protein KY289_027335 [Solanum tuberosum]|nr:hypothetical protein KY289_027335 [Solanum tuberosum]
MLKYQHDSHVLQRVSKHFFCENVYYDDSTDQPKPRWRFRNSFEEDLASAHMTYDDSYNKKINSVKISCNDGSCPPKYQSAVFTGVLYCLNEEGGEA